MGTLTASEQAAIDSLQWAQDQLMGVLDMPTTAAAGAVDLAIDAMEQNPYEQAGRTPRRDDIRALDLKKHRLCWAQDEVERRIVELLDSVDRDTALAWFAKEMDMADGVLWEFIQACGSGSDEKIASMFEKLVKATRGSYDMAAENLLDDEDYNSVYPPENPLARQSESYAETMGSVKL